MYLMYPSLSHASNEVFALCLPRECLNPARGCMPEDQRPHKPTSPQAHKETFLVLRASCASPNLPRCIYPPVDAWMHSLQCSGP